MSIDALRGLVMVIMLLDHVREAFFLYVPLTDPVDALTVAPSHFFSRLTSILCAPIFVALTGLGAYLYSQNHSKAETSAFLLKRGLFLLVIEMYMSAIWIQQIPPTIWLQVIWAIGLCMIVLAGLIHLPLKWVLALGLGIVCGHNLLDGIRLTPDDPMFVPWAILHQRDFISLPFGMVAKTSYPLLPWIGVIALGYSIGPWFARGADPEHRRRRLLQLGLGLVFAFVAIRFLNVYGDKPWFDAGDPLRTVMSFLSLTKYPPSLLFVLLTLGVGAWLLWLFERREGEQWLTRLAVFGAAPMFFYLFHITMLRILYHGAYFIYGPNHGELFGVSSIVWVWAWYVVLLVAFYFPTAWFSRLKANRRDIAWLKYL
jgi:uncharacterized membrane protein